MNWTDEIQTIVAVGSLIVGTVGFLMIYGTFRLQATTLVEQQKLTKLEGKKIDLQYKPWLVFKLDELEYNNELYSLHFELRNADLLNLRAYNDCNNKCDRVVIEHPTEVGYVKQTSILRVEFEYDANKDNAPEGTLFPVYFFEYEDLIGNTYRQNIFVRIAELNQIKCDPPYMV